MHLLRAVLAALALVSVALAGQTSEKFNSVSVSPDNSTVVPGEATVVAPVTNNVVSSNDAITIPQMMSYQGRLTDASGEPVPDGNYSVAFRLYTEPTGGSVFWNETQSVTTRDGLFSVLLGSVTPIGAVPDAGAAYLGMSVESSAEMTPRLRIAGTYASPRDGAGTSYVPPGGTDSDYDWVRIGSDSVLYTIHRLGLVRGESQNKLYGTYGYTQTIFGSSCTTGASGANVGNIAIGGGYGNRAWAPFTAVCGGRNNKAGNRATDTSAIVVGGYDNQASAKFAVVVGGDSNIAGGANAFVGGGYRNKTDQRFAIVVGGDSNLASGANAFVGDGYRNKANARFAIVVGGDSNVAGGANAFVGGGYSNIARGDYCAVGGGDRNTASGEAAAVGGGCLNDASNRRATVGGGYSNTATGEYATVGGGFYNNASNTFSAVSGGFDNTASGYNATVGGGNRDTASGDYSVVPGGYHNVATHAYSFAAGYRARAIHEGTFVWADATDADFTSTGRDRFMVRARGGTEFWGNVRVRDTVGNLLLQFGQGLDYAEGFHVSDAAQAAPGTVLTIDPVNTGKLKVSSRPYDCRVAGIVAGANDLGSGVKLGGGEFDHNVALAGRVYCNVDATTEGIEPGDLLTTSATPGYAMKAVDRERAQGAILGKAMERLPQGTKGLVLVLVTLQ